MTSTSKKNEDIVDEDTKRENEDTKRKVVNRLTNKHGVCPECGSDEIAIGGAFVKCNKYGDPTDKIIDFEDTEDYICIECEYASSNENDFNFKKK